MVEPQPSKLTTGVRFSSSAPLVNTRTSHQLVLFYFPHKFKNIIIHKYYNHLCFNFRILITFKTEGIVTRIKKTSKIKSKDKLDTPYCI